MNWFGFSSVPGRDKCTSFWQMQSLHWIMLWSGNQESWVCVQLYRYFCRAPILYHKFLSYTYFNSCHFPCRENLVENEFFERVPGQLDNALHFLKKIQYIWFIILTLVILVSGLQYTNLTFLYLTMLLSY